MLYPQNGDRIVAIDYVTALHPMKCANKTLLAVGTETAQEERTNGLEYL